MRLLVVYKCFSTLDVLRYLILRRLFGKGIAFIFDNIFVVALLLLFLLLYLFISRAASLDLVSLAFSPFGRGIPQSVLRKYWQSPT